MNYLVALKISSIVIAIYFFVKIYYFSKKTKIKCHNAVLQDGLLRLLECPLYPNCNKNEGFRIGLLLRGAREQKNLTQTELAEKVDKKREYISRVENNGSNLTLKPLFNIVEKGLGGKVKISIEV